MGRLMIEINLGCYGIEVIWMINSRVGVNDSSPRSQRGLPVGWFSVCGGPEVGKIQVCDGVQGTGTLFRFPAPRDNKKLSEVRLDWSVILESWVPIQSLI